MTAPGGAGHPDARHILVSVSEMPPAARRNAPAIQACFIVARLTRLRANLTSPSLLVLLRAGVLHGRALLVVRAAVGRAIGFGVRHAGMFRFQARLTSVGDILIALKRNGFAHILAHGWFRLFHA